MTSNHENGKAAKWLEAKYGSEFGPKVLPVGRRIDGTIVFHKFDLISPDNQIVAEVKAHKMNASGDVPSAKILDTYLACGMLEKISAKTKLLIFTHSSFYQSFRKNSYGKISRQIKIVCIAYEQPKDDSDLLLTPLLESKL